MLDLAYALLVEQFEGDGRAALAAGAESSPASYRDEVDEQLNADATSDRAPVSSEVSELRRALGVA